VSYFIESLAPREGARSAIEGAVMGSYSENATASAMGGQVAGRGALREAAEHIDDVALSGLKILEQKLGPATAEQLEKQVRVINVMRTELWARLGGRFKGLSALTRYADDFVMCFVHEEDARRVLALLGKRFALWCKAHRHAPFSAQHEALSRKLQGHCGYFGITGNHDALNRFHHQVKIEAAYHLSQTDAGATAPANVHQLGLGVGYVFLL